MMAVECILVLLGHTIKHDGWHKASIVWTFISFVNNSSSLNMNFRPYDASACSLQQYMWNHGLMSQPAAMHHTMTSVYCRPWSHILRPTVAEVAIKKMRGHLWYLSEDLIGLAFFSDCVLESENFKRKLCSILWRSPMWYRIIGEWIRSQLFHSSHWLNLILLPRIPSTSSQHWKLSRLAWVVDNLHGPSAQIT